MSLQISRSQVRIRYIVKSYLFEAYFYFSLFHFRKQLFVVFWPVFAKRSFASSFILNFFKSFLFNFVWREVPNKAYKK